MQRPRQINDDPLNAFCRDTEAYLEGASNGPLAGLTFAAKDIFDVAGHVTGCGNPDWKVHQPAAAETAWAVQVLVDAGATLVGKTQTVELTRGIFGENPHYGAPTNPRAPGFDPGGSSSGSAAAVAGDLVDFALGSDTLGSIRIPAGNCGLYGMRTTHGRIPLHGMMPQAPSYDTVGWFARDIETFGRVGGVLLDSGSTDLEPRALVVADDAFEIADDAVAHALQPHVEKIGFLIGRSANERLAANLVDWHRQQLILQSREAWESVSEWVDTFNPRMSYNVAKRYVFAGEISDADVASAREEREAVASRMSRVLRENALVCLPTTATPPRPLNEKLSTRLAVQDRTYSLVTIASTIGAPQINLPVAEVKGLPVGLSLIGPKGSDEVLIALAREVGEVGSV